MKPILLTFCILLLYTLPATAQVADSTNRWFFENATYAVLSQLTTGAEYTTDRTGRGNTTRLLYRAPLGRRFNVAAGLGLAVQQLRQRSTLDRFLCETNSPDCRSTSVDFVNANYASFALEIPLQLRYFFRRQQAGPYLLGAAAVQLPLFRSYDVFQVDLNTNETFVDEGEVRSKAVSYLSAGVGYQFRSSHRFAWYLEAVVGGSTGNVIEDAGIGGGGQLNYLRSARVRQLGLTGGLNF